MDYSKGPWKFSDSALVDSTGYEVIGIFPAYGDNNAWLTVGKEGNQLLLETAPDMYEALREIVDKDFVSELSWPLTDKIRAALAKIEGQ